MKNLSFVLSLLLVSSLAFAEDKPVDKKVTPTTVAVPKTVENGFIQFELVSKSGKPIIYSQIINQDGSLTNPTMIQVRDLVYTFPRVQKTESGYKVTLGKVVLDKIQFNMGDSKKTKNSKADLEALGIVFELPADDNTGPTLSVTIKNFPKTPDFSKGILIVPFEASSEDNTKIQMLLYDNS